MKSIHFTNDGIYGYLGREFDEDTARRVADAAACIGTKDLAEHTYDPPRTKVLIGYDTRKESKAIAQAVAKQIAGHNLTAVLAESYTPMPAINQALRKDDTTAGAIVVTGDHRGGEILGVRIRNHSGEAPHPARMDAIEDAIMLEAEEVQGTYRTQDFNQAFLTDVEAFIGPFKQDIKPFKIVVDSMHATAAPYLADMLSSLGQQVIAIREEPKEHFEDLHPEVVEPWIDECEVAVQENQADFGIAVDGPSNRAAIISNTGQWIPYSKLAALILNYLVKKMHRMGVVLLPRESSTIIFRAARALDIPYRLITRDETWALYEHLSPDQTLEDVLITGNGISSLALPFIDPERDAFALAVIMLLVLSASNLTLQEMVDALDKQIGTAVFGHTYVSMDAGRFELLKNLLPGINAIGHFDTNPQNVSHAEGLHLLFENGSWVYIRPSKTEPRVHIYVEAENKEEKARLSKQAQALLDAIFDDLS